MRSGARVVFIHNRRVARAALDEACRAAAAAGARVEIHTTRDREEGDRVARAVGAGADVLVAAGGDGTVQSVLGACLEHGAALAVLPLGTSNDLAVRLGLRDLRQAASALVLGEVRRVDTGRCAYVDEGGLPREDPFLTTAGVGVLAELARQERAGAPARLKALLGNASGPILFARAFAGVRGGDAEIAIDAVRRRRPVALLEVCKVPSPGGFTLAPGADLDSGTLHAWIFGAFSYAQVLEHLARAVASPGGHLRTGKVERVAAAQRIEIAPSSPLPVQVNGDYVGVTPASFEVLPSSLRLMVPPGARLGRADSPARPSMVAAE